MFNNKGLYVKSQVFDGHNIFLSPEKRGDSAGRRTPTPPPLGAFGQQLVAKGVALKHPWAPKPSMLHEHQRCLKENFVQFAHEHYP